MVSASLGRTFNLKALAEAFPHVQYRSKAFPAVVFRLEKPRAIVTLFESGKLVCVGACSEALAERAVLKVVEMLRSRGIDVEKPEVTVTNVVASGDLGSPVDLAALCERARTSRLMYEPEQFPAAIYKMENSHVAFIIFHTGKVVCLGAKKTEEAQEALKKLKQWLKEKKV